MLRMVKLPARSNAAVTRTGALARENLIEAAGEVFAAKGFDGATSREICERAGANTASVNYHFGGFDALYAATLFEAHRRAIWTDALQAIGRGKMPAKEKLIAILGLMVRRMAQPIAKSWEMRLLSRELISPTMAHAQFVKTALGPQRKLMRMIIAEIIGCKPQDPVVGRTLLSVMSPCIFLAIANRITLETFHPPLLDPEKEIDQLVAHMERFILAGLDAVTKIKGSTPAPRDAAKPRPARKAA